MRVVIDTNCLRASIPPKSPFYQLYLDFRAQKFDWYVSNEILLEYDEILTATYSAKTSQLVLHQLAIAPNVIFTEPAYKWNLITEDPDDNKFSDLAISTNADYLVTNDSHFNVFKSIPFPKLNVVDLASFLKILES
ncbi:putative toxin-antitoxin system toxin component, PIN family [Dyadobacter sp. CY312]|uniref:putative toxin-antitoxin system toxin component, PIN family n=1 Tax=Dyadobacter sp. CY312 TaxID=2907303 RepID=UPI001F305C03|nr:putative toxin-antitoxin system toxin component, PIN family [Dyadobacter sp. CY312]MCE7040655.1 putative toxin-antitoxin system toxin component, PIN family [Dyadobacter sp. CY312]